MSATDRSQPRERPLASADARADAGPPSATRPAGRSAGCGSSLASSGSSSCSGSCRRPSAASRTGQPGCAIGLAARSQQPLIPLYADLLRTIVLPNLAVFGWLIWLGEAAVAASLLLGLLTRLGGTLGFLMALNLLIGLAGVEHEWYWTYVMLALLNLLFALTGAWALVGAGRLPAAPAAGGGRARRRPRRLADAADVGRWRDCRPARGSPGLGLGIGLCCLGVVALGDLRAQLVAFIVLFFAAFAAYLVAAWLALRRPELAAGRRLWPLLGLALLYRLILLPAPPTLSDDLYRYAWEGRVLAAGLSPYRHAPDDPRLAPLRDAVIWPPVNNKSTPSPYPPLAQLGGLLGAWLTPGSPLGVKVVATAADLLTIGALLLLLRATGRPAGRVLVYAWHPLVLVAFAHSGHNDALMIAPLTLALALAAGGRRWWPAALLALAALAKLLPLLLLPLLPRRLGWGPTLLVGVVLLVVWLPFLLLGGGAIGSIVTYLGAWADNDSIHALLRLGLGEAGAKAASLLLLAAGLALLALHPRLRDRPLWWQAYVGFGLALALASTVHGWYLTWMLPPLAVHLAATGRRPWLRPLPALGWLLFSGLVALPT